MDEMFGFVIWMCAVAVAYLMAEKQGRDVRWAVIGGLVFGWFSPLYYLITKNSYANRKMLEELAKLKEQNTKSPNP